MKKLEQLNKLLNQGFSVDIFNYNDSNTNELHKKMLEKLDKYFKYTLSFEDLIKLTYGEDAEIIIRKIVKEEVSSNIENVDLSNPDKERIFDLGDLGYKCVSIDYYVRQGMNTEPTYIGTNNDCIHKYNEVLTEIGFMNRLEQILDIELNPNTEYSDLKYYKMLSNIMCERVPVGVESVDINNKIMTKDGNIIAKGINYKHFDGYSTDSFKPDKLLINFDFKTNTITSSLENIPDKVNTELQKTLKEYFYNNENEILKDVLEMLIEYINEVIKKLKEKAYDGLRTINNNHSSIVECSSMLNLTSPFISKKLLEEFESENKTKQAMFDSKYNKDKENLENNLKNVEKEINDLESEIEQLLEILNKDWEYVNSKQTDISAIDKEGYVDIKLGNRLEWIYTDFISFFEQDEKDSSKEIGKIKDNISAIRDLIEYGKGFDVFYHCYDFRVSDHELPFDAAEDLLNNIEKNLNKIELAEKNNDKNKLYNSIKTDLENLNYNYKVESSVYNRLSFHVQSIIKLYNDMTCTCKELANYYEFLTIIIPICPPELGNSLTQLNKKLQFFNILFNSIINGDIFNGELKLDDEVLELFETEHNENYLTLIKKHIIKNNN